ncbi:MAG: ATP synthase F1 subunit gamma [Prolixibacteraceae bacterium]|jgi:F-type H+-transporting ATPase subunit gamma|nr:ATP synthase F1 subunit gamma [Prolixibacteraceae bacterium]
MAKLKEIRTRIASVKNTRQVTSAMKLVSAAKLKRAQDYLLHIVPYEKKLDEILHNLTVGDIRVDSVFFEEREVDKALIIIIGSNRGLCGAFNSNVAKLARIYAKHEFPIHDKMNNIEYLPVGHQVEKELIIMGKKVFFEANDLIDNLDYESASKFVEQLMHWFTENKYQQIHIVYNKFKNAAVQELTTEQFLPVTQPEIKDPYDFHTEYIYEPTKSEVYNQLIPLALKMHFYSVMLDSNAAEHGARMTSMHQATDNATELLKDLRKRYNNARQSAITNEIIEITGGAEALNK